MDTLVELLWMIEILCYLFYEINILFCLFWRQKYKVDSHLYFAFIKFFHIRTIIELFRIYYKVPRIDNFSNKNWDIVKKCALI